MKRILVSAPSMLPVLDRFRPLFDGADLELVVAPVEERLTEEELLAHAGSIDGAICGDDPFTARVLQAAAPRLKVISKWGTGIDSIDRAEAERLGIQVFNTPGAFTEAVADTVLGLVLAFVTAEGLRKGFGSYLPTYAVQPSTLLIGLGITIGIGLIAGLAPAILAGRLLPPAALRSEG